MMMMKMMVMMKGLKLLPALALMALMFAALLINYSSFTVLVWGKSAGESQLSAAWTPTPGPETTNLKGKMFTLTSAGPGIRFYPPYYSDAAQAPSGGTYPSYGTNQPPTDSPGTNQPPNDSPGTNQPPNDSPGTNQPPNDIPGTNQPPNDSPGTNQPPTDIPGTNQPPNDSPGTNQPPTDIPGTNQPPNDSPGTNQPPNDRAPVTHRWTTRRPTPYWSTRYWTTSSPYTGVSVCLRYLGAPQSDTTPLFTLSPSTNPLKLSTNSFGTYFLPLRTFPYVVPMTPSIPLWKNVNSEMWTRVCLTLDSSRKVVQLFRGSNMSIRRLVPMRYAWSGEPVVAISGFDGQVTDLQVWDYPLRYKEVFNYMTNGIYMSYRGSVLSWSYISYSPANNALLEDVYEKQASQPISSSGRERRPKGEQKTKVVSKDEERNNFWFE